MALKRKSKTLSIFLTLVMLLMLWPGMTYGEGETAEVTDQIVLDEEQNMEAQEEESQSSETSLFGIDLPEGDVMPMGAGAVCKIGDNEYDTLEDALDDAKNDGGATIILLEDITTDQPILLEDVDITFALGIHDLTVDVSGTETSALQVSGGSVDYTGSGSFTVIGGPCGIEARAGATVTVTGAQTTRTEATAVYAGNAEVTVNGDVIATATPGRGVEATSGGQVTINGNVTAHSGISSIDEDSLVTVTGTVTAESQGVTATSKGKAVTGDIAVTGMFCHGVYATGGGEVTVNGGVLASGENAKGVYFERDDSALAGTATVNGDVEAEAEGIYILGGSVYVTGDVKSRDSYGVRVSGGQIVIDGEIDAPSYLDIAGSDRNKDSEDSIDSNGYWIYNGYEGSLVKVGNGVGVGLPAVTTTMIDPMEITRTGVRLRGSVTSNSGSAVTEFGFAYGLSPDPTTANHTIAGDGNAASFSADLTGLLPNTTYFVRAFATNSKGTAYGENRSFTTTAADPPGVPVNRRYLAHDGAMELFWEGLNDGGSPILYYEILSGGDLTRPWTNVGNVTSYRVTGLENGLYYTFLVRAVNAVGAGGYGVIQGRPNIPLPPGPPRELGSYTSNKQVRMYWREPWFNGYRDILRYEVSLGNNDWITPEYINSHTFTGLTNGTTYTFWVRAVNAMGAGEAASIQDTPRSSGGGHAGTPSGILVTPTGRNASDTGVDLSFPAGAVENNIRVQVRETALTSGMRLPADSQLVSRVMDIIKDRSGNFAEPVTITMSFNRSQVEPEKYDIKICYFDENSGEWVELDNIRVDLDGSTVSGEVNHFTKFAVIASLKAGEKEAPPLTPEPQPTAELPADVVGHWAQDSVAKLIAAGAVRGYPDGSFQPNKSVTRAEFTVMLVKALKLESKEGPVFKDTTGHWAKDSVGTAAAHGLISGYDQNTFGPNDRITREQAAVIIVRAAGLQGGDQVLNFSDAQQISPWALPGVAAAVSNAYLGGYSDNSFRPQGYTSRAEAAAIIAKLL